MPIERIKVGSRFKKGGVEIKVTGISIFRPFATAFVGCLSDVRIAVERLEVGAPDALSCGVVGYDEFLRQLDNGWEAVE